MNKIQRALILLLSSSFIMACSNKEYHYSSHSFILHYSEPTDITFSKSYSNKDNSFTFVFGANGKSYDFRSEGEEKKKFDSLCEKYDDTHYQEDTRLIQNNISLDRISFEPAIKAISVTSTSDFDEQHPAGSNLGDLIEISYSSANSYIKGGYKDQYHLIKNRISQLSDIQQNDLILLVAEGINCKFIKTPTSGILKHNLTVSVSLDDDRILENSVNLDFINDEK